MKRLIFIAAIMMSFLIVKGQDSHKGLSGIYLTPLFAGDLDLENLIPFGFQITDESTIDLQQQGDLQKSAPVSISDASDLGPFETAVYYFHDSTMFKARLLATSGDLSRSREELEKVLSGHFGHNDFSNAQRTVFSDGNFLVSVDYQAKWMEIVSMGHQPLQQRYFRMINLKNCKTTSMFWYELSPSEAIGLEFYNQITKDNNVQMAFRIYYKGEQALDFNTVGFSGIDGETISFNVEPMIEITNQSIEKVSRCFISAGTARKILSSDNIVVNLSGARKRSYKMPAYQRHSLQAALFFYKHHVTHPLIPGSGG